MHKLLMQHPYRNFRKVNIQASPQEEKVKPACDEPAFTSCD